MVNFDWATQQINEGKKVRRTSWDSSFEDSKYYSIFKDGVNLLGGRPKEHPTVPRLTISDINGDDWVIYVEPEGKYDGMDIEELIHQAHMKGQMDYGCESPGYSNAQSDCKEIVEAAKKCVLLGDKE